MILPHSVRSCINALEAAGFPTYAVGGCVRDSLLGLVPHDYDLCTAATPEQIQEIFSDRRLVLSGVKHGTVGVIVEHQVCEITTFRTEGGYRDSRHPDWVSFVTDINQDLARRDFTVNAIAYSPARGYADPWGGRQDLQNKVLRAVGDPTIRFSEDALRILRGVRFAVKYALTPEKTTLAAMQQLAPTMNKLARERVFDELCKLLVLVSAEDLLHYWPILAQVIPELAPCMGFDQKNPHHIHDVFTHTAHVVAGVEPTLPLRWAALLHDIGKPPCFELDESGTGHFLGHAKVSAQMAEEILQRLKAPTALRETVVLLIRQHMTPLYPDRKLLRRRMSKFGTEAVQQLLLLQQADHKATRPDRSDPLALDETAALLAQLIQENACITVKDLALNGQDLLALGYAPGPALGAALQQLLMLVLDEQLPNEREALLQAARQHKEEFV